MKDLFSNKKKKSILLIYNELPIPTFGGNIRVYYLLKELSKQLNVTLLVIPARREQRYDKSKLNGICKVIFAPCFIEDVIDRNFVNYFLRVSYYKCQSLFQSKAKLILQHNYQIFCLRKELLKLLKKRNFDYIQVEHSFFGKVLDGINTQSIKILDFQNVYSFMENNSDEMIKIRRYESGLSKKYDIALCCSEIDKKRLASLGYKNVLIVPNGVNISEYRYTEKINNPTSLLFIGTFLYGPNIKGIKYFLNQILPLLPKDLKINLIGSYRNRDFQDFLKNKNVIFHGFVDDINPFLKNAIFICPLLDGGGTRLKILTAFAAGSPVVSTTKGAEGIECTNNKDILIADSPKFFAKRIKDLLSNQDLFIKLKHNAFELVKKKYSWDITCKNYIKYLKSLK